MRVAILTLPLHTNYGGIIQALALQTVLENMGHDVKVINKDWHPRRIYWLTRYPQRIVRKYLFRENIPIFYEQHSHDEYERRATKIIPFIEHYISRRQVQDLSDIRDEFDALVIGSDQIWRPCYFASISHRVVDAFGAFANKWNIRRLSYAASFGVDNLNEFNQHDIRKIKKILRSFCGVSVRESSGVELCKKYFGIEAIQVLDPTMLLPKDFYENLIKDCSNERQQGIMEYILDPDSCKNKIINEIKKQTKLPSFSTISSSEQYQASLEQWLAGFRDASLVVTDSFHACVFSIIFHKPFIVVSNPERGLSRITSLLDMFGLQHHLVDNMVQIRSIDGYILNNQVYETLLGWQKRSMQFLLSSLKG